MDSQDPKHQPSCHRKKHYNDRKKGPPLPGPAWMGFGIAIGIAAALLLFVIVWAALPKEVKRLE